jgi:hypothetical protein
MDFGEIFRVLLMRWRVSVPTLLLTLAATATMWHTFPVTYQSEAQLTLLGSQSLSDASGGGHNPFLAVGTLGPMADILATTASSQQAAHQLKRVGLTDAYTVEVPPNAAGPFIALSVTGKSRETVEQSMSILVRFVEQQLAQLQRNASTNIAKKNLIGSLVIAAPSTPGPITKSKLEAAVSVAIAGMLLMLLGSFGAEGRARRRGLGRRSGHLTDAAERRRRQPNGTELQEDARQSAPL